MQEQSTSPKNSDLGTVRPDLIGVTQAIAVRRWETNSHLAGPIYKSSSSPGERCSSLLIKFF